MGSVDVGGHVPQRRCVAPVWRRLVAGLISMAVSVVSLAGIGFAAYRLRRLLGPSLRPLTTRLERWREAQDWESGKVALSLRTRMVLEVISLAFELDGGSAVWMCTAAVR